MGDILVGLLDAAALLVHQPAVIAAADAARLDPAMDEVGAAVRAMPIDQAEAAGQILVEDEVLAEQAHRLDRRLVELARAGHRKPVAAQQLAHGRARPDAGEHLVPGGGEHLAPPCGSALQMPLTAGIMSPLSAPSASRSPAARLRRFLNPWPTAAAARSWWRARAPRGVGWSASRRRAPTICDRGAPSSGGRDGCCASLRRWQGAR